MYFGGGLGGVVPWLVVGLVGLVGAEETMEVIKALEARVVELESVTAAQDLETRDVLHADDGNAFWLMFGIVLVFLMQAGFAMLEVGSVQVKHTKFILIKNIFDASIAAFFWWATGYGIAFGTDSFSKTGKNGFFGGSGFFYEGVGSGDDASPLTNTPFAKTYGKAFWVFQWAFAGAAATIVSGAVAERCSMKAYFVYSCVISGVIYPALVHMAWSNDGRFSAKRTGRLIADCGLLDWAGSGVVHLTGGIAALVGCVFVGPRSYRFGRHARHLQQQSQVFQTLGTLLLWVGWYGFNGVSSLAIDGYGGVAAHSMMTTTISAAASCLATTFIGYLLDGTIEPVYSNNGILAGLVAITAGCATSNLYGAFFTGLFAAPIYLAASRTLEYLEIDDVVDAFPVHGCNGAWGVIAASLFATEFYYSRAYAAYIKPDSDRASDCAGVFYGGDGGSLAVALAFVATNLAWTSATMIFLLTVLKLTVGIRVSESEDEGMDDSKHGGQAGLGGQVDVFIPHDAKEHVSGPGRSGDLEPGLSSIHGQASFVFPSSKSATAVESKIEVPGGGGGADDPPDV